MIGKSSSLAPISAKASTSVCSGLWVQYSSISQSTEGWFPVQGQNTAAVVSPAFFAASKISGTFTNSCSQIHGIGERRYCRGDFRFPGIPCRSGKHPVAMVVWQG